MAPNTKTSESLLKTPEDLKSSEDTKQKLVHLNLLTFGYGHLAGLYGLYLCFTSAKWPTIFLNYVLLIISELGVTAGAHRLWAHKTYKAKLPLQILLMIFNSVAFQNTATDWVRDHRMHHKYSDTDADPHNSNRGFFYSHVGWLLMRKHPEVKRLGKGIEMRDIYSNPVLRFQKRYALPVIGAACFILPTVIPVYCWGETLSNSWHVTIFRYVVNLNVTFLVNSAAHIWGNKPYDKTLRPAQNIPVALLTLGEGFHNYHHVFPWDYRTAELGNNKLNVTTFFINFFAWIGWAYDLKTAPDDMIRKRVERTGDGTNMWGWGDKDMSKDDRESVKILGEKFL
ncbi:acyl-CoA Delta(11) desaturase-like [Pectinophora gossypiella]|uniref:acyl-CoA Delta(11) desaturase-like n=1 Tax=Pectinophora gossypiella TaxID=13191 RepID=UPI00214E5FB5|nr:acyl-CoA Delta(11) desaturase-like [Pectinophora gossypiella]